MQVYQAIGKTLQRLGVDTAFGLIGSGNFRIINYMTEKCDIAYYASRHEAGAVSMADAYARVTGKLGVCTVHQGPGVTNTLTALAEAVKNRTPLLLLAGDTPTTSLYQNFDLDQSAVVRSVGAGVEHMRSTNTIVEYLTRAARRAEIEGRPIMVSVPVDLQEQSCEMESLPTFVEASMSNPRPPEEIISKAVYLLESASRPVIIAGRGAVEAGAREQLEMLGERIGALFATSAMAKGFFAENPFDLGISGGFSSSLAVRLIGEADLILAFGASLNVWTIRYGKLFSSTVRVIHCDLEPLAIGCIQPATIGVIGDAAETADALLAELDLRSVSFEGFRTKEVTRVLENFRWEDEFEAEDTEEWVDPRSLLLKLDGILPKARTVAVDCGHFAGFAARHLSVPHARGFVFADAFQAVGLGLAAGIGAAVASPDRLAVAVVGDGGLLMSLGEVSSAVDLGLPLLVVVMNDAAYGAEVHLFGQEDCRLDLVRFRANDFTSIANGLGAQGILVRSEQDLDQLREWLEAPAGTMILDCKIDPTVRGDYSQGALLGESTRSPQ